MRSYKSILLQSPTGSGKTAMAIYMIIKAVEKQAQKDHLKNRKIIFTVPRKTLLKQTSESLTKYGIAHSFIASGKPHIPTATVFIGMVDTMGSRIVANDAGVLSRKDGSIPEGYIVLVDETHFGAAALARIIEYYKKQGAWVIGLSATPWKLNGQGLGVWYDTMVMGKSIAWLIENKRLCDYDYYYGKHKPDLSKISKVDGEYNQAQLAKLMEKEGVIIGDCVADYKKRCMGRLHIVACTSINHSQMVAESFRKAGIPAEHVDGDTPEDELKAILMAFARREIWVLTFCDLLNFGFDLAQATGMDVTVESCSDMKPRGSLAAQLQFWGRVLRMKDFNAIINDHVNNYKDHGLPCSDRDWTLEGRKKKKKGAAEPVSPTRQCPECRCVHKPAPICPQCKWVYIIEGREIEEVDGELLKLDKEKARLQRKRDVFSIKSLDGLIEYGKAQNYKNPVGWASHVFKSREEKEKKNANPVY